MFLNNVEVYNCSQMDSFKSAIRFESAVTKHSEVINSTFHNGYGWGANIKGSANIFMQDNLWFNFRPHGVVVDYSKNITLDNNVLGHFIDRTTIETTAESYVDPAGGFCICSYLGGPCPDIKVTNNIAGGGVFAGFILPALDCGDDDNQNFRGNVAHSMYGVESGVGGWIFPNEDSPKQKDCIQFSHFAAYKCWYQGVMSLFEVQNAIFKHMTMIDNREGMGLAL